MLQCDAVLLQCAAMCGSVWQCVAVCCSVLQRVAVCCNVLQYVAARSVCCSVLRCVAESCSVLHCFAVCCCDVLCACFCYDPPPTVACNLVCIKVCMNILIYVCMTHSYMRHDSITHVQRLSYSHMCDMTYSYA